MATIALATYVLKACLLQIAADNYEKHVAAATLAPTVNGQTFKAIDGSVTRDTSVPEWTLTLDYAQDWTTANSLAAYLLANVGTQKTIILSPRVGCGQTEVHGRRDDRAWPGRRQGRRYPDRVGDARVHRPARQGDLVTVGTCGHSPPAAATPRGSCDACPQTCASNSPPTSNPRSPNPRRQDRRQLRRPVGGPRHLHQGPQARRSHDHRRRFPPRRLRRRIGPPAGLRGTIRRRHPREHRLPPHPRRQGHPLPHPHNPAVRGRGRATIFTTIRDQAAWALDQFAGIVDRVLSGVSDG